MKKVSLFALAMIPLCAMAQIVVSPELLSFGDVSEAERPVKTIQLINRGDKTVRIEEIVKTCVTQSAKAELEPFGVWGVLHEYCVFFTKHTLIIKCQTDQSV